ncbi:Hypothetical protein PBC10988_9630 [Planctomycetales bacterium 10988]|nr:Hypothetical protein PBC10988_9630 [Planctomycetales bacterium 10988]
MEKSSRSGFTLVELLVVMSIIAILAAMLMPAVNAVRETARRTQCTNQIRNVSIALMQHDAAKGYLPGWAVSQNPNYSTVEGGNAVGWVFPTLPFMERNDIFNRYNANAAANTRGTHPNQTLKVLLCPNDPAQTGPQMTYAANCGMRNLQDDNGQRFTPAADSETSSHSYWKESIKSSVFHNDYLIVNPGTNNTIFWPGRNRMSLAMVSADDGTATTLMVGENLDAWNWSRAGGTATANVQVFESDVCICYYADNVNTAPTNFNTDTFTMRINGLQGGDRQAARPKSRHPGGVNVVFCDQHTKFLADEIDWFTYSAIYTPSGSRLGANEGPRDYTDPQNVPQGRALAGKYRGSTVVDEDMLR